MTAALADLNLKYTRVFLEFSDTLDQILTAEIDTAHHPSFPSSKGILDNSLNKVFDKSYTQCAWLARAKVYSIIRSKNQLSNKKLKSYKLLSQGESFQLLWTLITERICRCVDETVQNILQELKNSEIDKCATFVMAITKYTAILSIRLDSLSSTCKYVNDYYFSMVLAPPEVRSVNDFGLFYFLKKVIASLNGEFVHYLDRWIAQYRKGQPSLEDTGYIWVGDENFSKCSSAFLRILHSIHIYNIPIDSEKNDYFVKDFYEQNLSQYLDDGIDIPFDENYLGALQKQVLKEKSICKHMLGDSGDSIVFRYFQSTILKREVLEQILSVYIFERCPDNELLQIKYIYGLMKKLNILYQSIERVVPAKCAELPEGHFGIVKVLVAFDRLFTVFPSNKSIIMALKEGTRSLFGSDLEFLESVLKWVDSKIKKNFYSLIQGEPIQENEMRKTHDTLQILINFLVELDIMEVFLKLYLSRSFFRRVILMDSDYLKFSDNPLCIEHYISTILLAKKTGVSSSPQLSDLTMDVEKSKHLWETFRATSTGKVELVPLLFQKSNVPDSFQQTALDIPSLPQHLSDVWNEFLNHYNSLDPNSKKKTIMPQYTLHHLEVGTEFRLSENQYLILEVNLLQSCILELFNDADTLSFSEIKLALQVDGFHLSQALRSFSEIGLLHGQNGIYKLNTEYIPDRKKVKDGKLRITYRPPRATSKPAYGNSGDDRDSSWKKELLKLSIVRSLKGEHEGLSYDRLYEIVTQQITGFSVGEFKTALTECGDYYTISGNKYFFTP